MVIATTALTKKSTCRGFWSLAAILSARYASRIVSNRTQIISRLIASTAAFSVRSVSKWESRCSRKIWFYCSLSKTRVTQLICNSLNVGWDGRNLRELLYHASSLKFLTMKTLARWLFKTSVHSMVKSLKLFVKRTRTCSASTAFSVTSTKATTLLAYKRQLKSKDSWSRSKFPSLLGWSRNSSPQKTTSPDTSTKCGNKPMTIDRKCQNYTTRCGRRFSNANTLSSDSFLSN